VLNLDYGCVTCRDCGGAGEKIELGAQALEAMRYLSSAPAKQILSFGLPDEDLRRLSRASEHYLRAAPSAGFQRWTIGKRYGITHIWGIEDELF
jgi:hypothetical protein